MAYQPQGYWERRLGEQFSPRGVGHIEFSDAYNAWLYWRKRRCIEACLAGVDLRGKQVLDIGCGTGFFVEWYGERGAAVCGLDITRVSVEKLRQKHPRFEFHTLDIGAANYPLAGRRFDIVNMWDVGYHIVDDRRFNQALHNIACSLKGGGLVLFTDRFGAGADRQVAEHVKFRCLETYRALLSSKGFREAGVHPLYRHLNRSHRRRLDERLAWLYARLDDRSRVIPANNVSLGVWRYEGSARADRSRTFEAGSAGST